MGVTVTPVGGDVLIQATVPVSDLQTGVQVTNDVITGTVKDYTPDPSDPDLLWLDGHHVFLDITPAQGESISGQIVTGPSESPVRGIAGHHAFYLDGHNVQYFDVTSTDGERTLTQRFYFDLTLE